MTTLEPPVHVEPNLPASEPTHQTNSGVVTKSTLRLLVGFELSSPPLFETGTGLLIGARREIGYWLVGLLEAIRRTWVFGFRGLRERPPGFFRRSYRRIRGRVAAAFLLPSYRLPTELDVLREWQVEDPGFEASRRIYDLRQDQTSLKIVYHVFAQRHEAVTNRLLEESLDGVMQGSKELHLCDIGSHFCLLGRSSFRIRRRQYWEIVIGPTDLLAEELPTHVEPPPELMNFKPDIGPASKEHEQSAPTVGDVAEANSAGIPAFGSAFPSASVLRRINERSAVDWHFMSHRIDEALAERRELDEEFVERLARERYAHAKKVLAEEHPGPTLESSRRIAHEVVEIHRLGHEADADR